MHGTKVRLVLLLFAWLPGSFLSAQAVKDLPRPTNYVSDYAHVLSPQVTERLNRICDAADHQAQAQVAVITVKDTDQEPISQYAVQLEDAWGVGAKGTDRGVILLVSVDDRQYFISTGYGLEGTITDERAGIIGRQMQQYLRVGQYDQGITLATEQLAGTIARAAGVQLRAPMEQVGSPEKSAKMGLVGKLITGVVLVLIFLLAARTGMLPFLLGMFLGGGFGGRGGRGGGGDGGGGGGGFGGFGGGSTGGGGAGGSF